MWWSYHFTKWLCVNFKKIALGNLKNRHLTNDLDEEKIASTNPKTKNRKSESS
jgi:hypothetical protein